MKLFMVMSAVNLVLKLLTNIRVILTCAVVGSVLYAGILMYNNDMDIELAWEAVKSFWVSAWEFLKQGWAWVRVEFGF